MIQRLTSYTLELTLFVAGAVLMILEILGARILAPYIGTSIMVWSILIAVILTSMSIGYMVVGRLADRDPSHKTLAVLLMVSAILILCIAVFKDIVLMITQSTIRYVPLRIFISIVILFSIPSCILAGITPYIFKLKANSLKKIGTTIGNLQGISTIGSITGTLGSGVLLIPYFGVTNILFFLSFILIMLSFINAPNLLNKLRIFTCLLVVINVVLYHWFSYVALNNKFISLETAYNHIWIYDIHYPHVDKTVRFMRTDINAFQSALILEDDALFFEYTKYYKLADYFNPGFRNVLIIGGGAFTVPKDMLSKFPHTQIDVVEIDPALTILAQKYFSLENNDRLRIISEDGRAYLNTTSKMYDLIFSDAFSSITPPFQLATTESVEKQYRQLNDNGVVMVDLPGSLDKENGKLVFSEYHTYKQIFPYVYLFRTDYNNPHKLQNIILIALKKNSQPILNSSNKEYDKYLSRRWTGEIPDFSALTDDYAPVDYFTLNLLHNTNLDPLYQTNVYSRGYLLWLISLVNNQPPS